MFYIKAMVLPITNGQHVSRGCRTEAISAKIHYDNELASRSFIRASPIREALENYLMPGLLERYTCCSLIAC